MPSVRGRTPPCTGTGGSSKCRAFAGGRGRERRRVGSSRCRAFAAVDGGRVVALATERSREDAARTSTGDELWVPSVHGRTQPWTGTGGSSGCRDFAGGRGRVGALGVERSREDAAKDGWVGALGAERSREDAAVHGDGWEL